MRSDGNALIIILFTVMVILILLMTQTSVTRANVAVVDRRTTSAQLGATTLLRTPARLRQVATNLPAFLRDTVPLPTKLSDSGTLATLQGQLDTTWRQCRETAFRVQVHLAGQPSCGVPDPRASQRSTVTSNTLSSTGLTEYRVPLYVRTTVKGPHGGRRSREAQGEAVLLGMNPMPSTAFHVLTGNLGAPVPAGLILDGPVHVNGRLQVAAGRSAFLSVVSSAQRSMDFGSATWPTAQPGPFPALPCDPQSSTCATFDNGLGLGVGTLPINGGDVESQAGLRLPGSVHELVLTPNSNGGTTVFTCTSTACNRYWLQPDGDSVNVWQHTLSSPVPPRNGLVFAPPEPGSNPWTLVASRVTGLILAPNDLSVRALIPAGPAFQGQLSVAANNRLTVTSSLRAQTPVCDSYPVRDTDGELRPASCQQSSPDQLGLISVRGNIDIGNSSLPLPEGDTSIALHASLMAARGTVALRDTRPSTLDWTGSVMSQTFIPDARMRLAFDARVRRPPGFPNLNVTATPPVMLLGRDTELDLP